MNRLTPFFISGTLTAVFVGVVVNVGLFAHINTAFQDRLFSDRPVDRNITIIAIDNKSLSKLGQWPLPRSVYAELLKVLEPVQPEALAIDVIFPEESRIGEFDDNALETALQNVSYPVVLPVEALGLRLVDDTAQTDEILTTLPRFNTEQVKFAHINLIQDRDGVVRRVPLSLTHNSNEGSTQYQSLSAALVGERVRRDVEEIVFSGPPGTVQVLSLSDVLTDQNARNTLIGKYVLLGATASDLHDEQFTPTNSTEAMSGVEIQAQIATMLRRGYVLTPIHVKTELIVTSILSLIPFLFFIFLPRARYGIGATLATFVILLVALQYQYERGVLISIFYTSFSLIFGGVAAFATRYFILDRERRQVRMTFSKYVSRDVLEELMADPSKASLGGREAEVTVFFSDIRGFTTLSEGLSPRGLTDLLNRYLTRMTDIILHDNGVVDKYIGDAIMAFWGAPLDNPRHPLDAILSSLTMLEALDRFNEESSALGDPPINIGIGLNTGEVIVGNMGSHQRFDYTIMGDTVNLGARLEGQTKSYGVRLLISEFTAAHISEEMKREHNLLIRELDKVTVKGKKLPVAVFEVVERKDVENVREMGEEFIKLREAYYDGKWPEVIELGKKILKKRNDGPTQVLLERAEIFKADPPENWNGVFELKTK